MTVCAITTVIAVAACTAARGPAPVRESAEIVDSAICRMPEDATFLGLTPPHELSLQVHPRVGVVPDDFTPIAAVTCDELLAQSVSAELNTTFVEHRWEGNFATAVERLNASSEGPRLDQDSCPIAGLVALPDLWLIDEHGRALRPSYPVDDCGFQQIGGLREVEALELTEHITHTVQLAPDQLNQWMGCGIEAAIPVVGDRTVEPGRYTLGSSVCRYITDTEGVTRFAGADQLISSLEDAFDLLPTAIPCTGSATSVVNTSISLYGPKSSTPQTVYIELDGCHRILITDHHPLTANDAVIFHFS